MTTVLLRISTPSSMSIGPPGKQSMMTPVAELTSTFAGSP